jgi:hypothetical protein
MGKENFINRKQYKFYKSYFEIAKEITDYKERSDYLMAICEYQFTGVEPQLTGMAKFAFLSQKHSLEKQVVGYDFATNKTTTPDTYPTGVSIPIPIEHTPTTINNNKETIDNKEYIINNKKSNNTASPFSFFNDLINYGFDKNLVSDWLKVRKTKKATNTQTSFNSFINEIEKRNCNLNEILEFIVVKNWSGFKWSWYDAEIEKEKSSEQKEKVVAGRQTMETIKQNLDTTGLYVPSQLKNS